MFDNNNSVKNKKKNSPSGLDFGLGLAFADPRASYTNNKKGESKSTEQERECEFWRANAYTGAVDWAYVFSLQSGRLALLSAALGT